jgi:hypothetical protein
VGFEHAGRLNELTKRQQELAAKLDLTKNGNAILVTPSCETDTDTTVPEN